MRLIDADKLREKLIIDYEVRETYFGEMLLKEIDESPTVENITVFCENADEKTLEDLKAELQSVIEARQQGEWIGNAFDEHHCNRCGHPALWEEEPDGYYEVQSRFCPNCGADMRGKEE